MNMTRNRVSALIILAVAVVTFNVVAFAVPFVRGPVFWLGYAFGLVAILGGAAAIVYALGRKGLRSKFYGLPLASLAWSYIGTQITASFVEMRVFAMPTWLALVINVIILAVAAVGLVLADVGTEAIKQIDGRVGAKVFYIRSLQADVELMMDRAGDPGLRKSLGELAEALRYSDPMSSDSLAVVENTLEVKVAQLAELVGAEDPSEAISLVAESRELVAERNRKAKLLKGMGA